MVNNIPSWSLGRMIAKENPELETTLSNTTPEGLPRPRHDILEVNNYFMSGLVVSSIDKWFMGPVPQFSLQDMGVSGDRHDLSDVLKRAESAAADPEQVAWQLVGPLINSEHLMHCLIKL